MSDDDLEVTVGGGGYIPRPKMDLEDMTDEDEALTRWKKQLGVRDEDFILLDMAVIMPRRPTVIMDLRKENPEEINVVVKEGSTYSANIRFKVNNQTLHGLKYQQTVRRMMLAEKMSKDLGDIEPSSKVYEKTVIFEDAPAGILARGSYIVESKLVNGDDRTLVKWQWHLEIKKDW